MNSNWKLFYKPNDAGEMQFAELLTRDGESTLREGVVFTHGTTKSVDSFEETSERLLGQGYHLRCDWHFDRNARDYRVFVDAIRSAISAIPEVSIANALAILTDADFMTIGLASHHFDDIASAEDDKLWIVDEWDVWNEDWQLDPAYRWLLTYGYFDDLDEEIYEDFHAGTLKALQQVLKSLPDTIDIRLIYVGGDDVGHKWSAECMDTKLANRMLTWIMLNWI